jgi:hypothetical protein
VTSTLLDAVLFETFSQCYDPPFEVIENFIEGGPTHVREALRAALENVPERVLRAMDADARAQAEVCFARADTDNQARLHVVSEHIARCIQSARIAEVAKPPSASARPYGHSALSGIDVDAEGLVALSAFEVDGDALCVRDHAFFMMPPVPGSNAAYWLLEQLQRHGLGDCVRVRLDPWLHGPAAEMRGRFYRAAIWARPLDWNRIRTLRETEHGRWTPGKMSRRFAQTDYAWTPHDDEVDFLCEELPILEEVDVRGARYLHAVYNKRRHLLTHLDGALRIYSGDNLAARALEHVRNAGKAGTRAKIFRTDSPVKPEVFSSIAEAFFFWNYDVARYFGAQLPADF